jgi:hypothetical protein
MNTSLKDLVMITLNQCLRSRVNCLLVFALTLSVTIAASAAEAGATYVTPEDAVAALGAAVSKGDTNALRAIFGLVAADLVNPDRVQATNELRAFATALHEKQRIVRESDSRCVLEVGDDFWPFPVPMVKLDGRWCFDARAGKDEILSRRIGRNELSTLRSMRAYVDAQREYASKDRDGDQVLEYAQKFRSTPGTKDGLYWPDDLDGELSPLGPLVAQAQYQGYFGNSKEQVTTPAPFHGYFFKILTCQGKSAPGGKYDYIINGNMIGGFALLAWPAEYGETGVMTFIVNHQGRVFQKNLGPKTAKTAAGIKSYDPDHTWAISPE